MENVSQNSCAKSSVPLIVKQGEQKAMPWFSVLAGSSDLFPQEVLFYKYTPFSLQI
jgi:hypothetical protein